MCFFNKMLLSANVPRINFVLSALIPLAMAALALFVLTFISSELKKTLLKKLYSIANFKQIL